MKLDRPSIPPRARAAGPRARPTGTQKPATDGRGRRASPSVRALYHACLHAARQGRYEASRSLFARAVAADQALFQGICVCEHVLQRQPSPEAHELRAALLARVHAGDAERADLQAAVLLYGNAKNFAGVARCAAAAGMGALQAGAPGPAARALHLAHASRPEHPGYAFAFGTALYLRAGQAEKGDQGRQLRNARAAFVRSHGLHARPETTAALIRVDAALDAWHGRPTPTVAAPPAINPQVAAAFERWVTEPG